MPNPPHASARPSESWSEVRAHDHVMRYRRSGAGRAVLVLHSPDEPGEPSPLWPELADALAAHFRLIVPEVPPSTGADAALWLAEFLEGLGIAGVAVVATDPFCIPALELALLDGDQIARVVLVPGGASTDGGLDGALATATRTSSLPLLLVRRGLPAAEALPRVTGFLAGEGGASPG